MPAVSGENVNTIKAHTQKASNYLHNFVARKINMLHGSINDSQIPAQVQKLEQKIVRMFLPEKIIDNIKSDKIHILADDDTLYFAVEKARTADAVKVDLIDIAGSVMKKL